MPVKSYPDYPWKEKKKLLLVLRLDLPNSVILLLTGPSSAFEKWYGHGTSQSFFLSVEGMSGVVVVGVGGGGGGGTRGG